MAAITDLAAASSVAGTDLLVVSQSGTDRKATADKFARTGTTNAATTFGGVEVGGTAQGVGIYDSKFTQVKTASFTLADDAVWLTPTKLWGFAMIAESAGANYALVYFGGGLNSVTSIAKSANTNVNADTDGGFNIYYDSGNAKYAIRNRLGVATGIRVIVFDMAA